MVDDSGSVSVTSAFGHEVSDVLLGNWEVKVVREHLLDVSGVDLLFISLVEESEALTGLLSVSVLLDVSVSDAVQKEVIFETSSLQEIWVVLSDFIIHFFC